MDFQPNNLFVRRAEDRVEQTTSDTLVCYRYVSSTLVKIPARGAPLTLRPKTFVATWPHYTRREAQQALGLPGPAPTHVLKLLIPPGVRIQGPAWIDALPASQLLYDGSVERFGNGIEFLILDPVTLGVDQYEILEIGEE